MTKERIREFALAQGADDIGFAAAGDYRSARSPELANIMPGARSLVVLAYRELSNCESESPQVAMTGRLDLMEFARSVNYRVARALEREGSAAMTVPMSYPLAMNEATKGAIGDVSTRHAAVAAGLGRLGRHNLVIHPRFGTRVIFGTVLTSAEFASDPPVVEELCTGCGLCVEACPGNALADEGRTDIGRCLRNSQPYGIAGSIRFWSKFAEAEPEARKAMVRDSEYWRLYQAGFIGFQYFCFRCLAACPIGRG